MQARTIAIVPGRGRMHLNLALQFDFGNAAQVLPQDFMLDLELVFVAGVLIVAPAAASKVWAGRRHAVRRRLYDCSGVGARETRPIFGECGLDLFASENKGYENSLAASARVGREAGETVAAVDKLFDV